ncbi:MAG: enoyl-CoA hydratase/isomerase family protein [Promethearchaeota archaeon]|nr:MAG: enoyl-CoA hydratase/isomerase family protein [Candidatus Lokiarchaeota archaeon]
MIEVPLFFTLAVDIVGGIITARLNRPQKMNAFTAELLDELEELFNFIKDNSEIEVLILSTVSDSFFSAGVDVNWFVSLKEEDAISVSRRFHEVFNKLETLPIPVLTIVKGTCFTAGMEMIYCSDLIFCTPNAKFAQLEVKYGITPGAGGTQRLIRLVGPLKAKEIIYSGIPIGAEEAHRIGLINHIYNNDEIEGKVLQFAHTLEKNSIRAIKECKSMIKLAIYDNVEGFEKEEEVFKEDFASLEPKQRLSKVIEKIQHKKEK